ncbi:MAG TPA: hypothetical protein VF098_03070 [Sphingomicrobium sp.]
MAKKKELVLVGGKSPQMKQAPGKNWSKGKAQSFLGVLAETCNVTEACRASGVSLTTVYRHRKTDAAFRSGWREAIGIAYSRLELELLERAFVGTEKVLIRKDGGEERMREYSHQLGLALLKMHRDTALEAAPENEPDNIDEIRERLFNKLERMRKREEARGRAE